MVNSTYKSLIEHIDRPSCRICGNDLFVLTLHRPSAATAGMHKCCFVRCPYMHVCLPICDNLCVCMCVRGLLVRQQRQYFLIFSEE